MTKAKLDEIRAMMNDPKVISGEGLSNEENIAKAAEVTKAHVAKYW